jgi:N-methylhydantoinase A/oxoprolinase/acetone carboxylase beta subunit
VFSAFGGNTTDIQHLYSHTFGAAPANVRDLETALSGLLVQARRDMQGEGFLQDAELEISFEAGPRTFAIRHAISTEASTLAAALWDKVRGQPIEMLRLTASRRTPHWTPQARSAGASRPSPRGERAIWWAADGATPTPVFAREDVTVGAVIDGPAIVEGPDTTYAINPGFKLAVDELGSLTITKQPRA